MAKAARRAIPRTPQQQQILDALTTPIQRAPLSTAYRMGLLGTAFAMLTLPIIYLGLIVLIAHTVYWCAVAISSQHDQPPKVQAALLAMLLPGVITVVFLIKPIFAKWHKGGQPLKLKREAEPFLFDYIEALCKSINAPIPKSIRIDCEANASAGLRRGLWSIFSNDLALTIGLPLMAGLNMRQMTGVLAHEFGHFSQGYGMRLTAVIRFINFWFMRAAYERDAWDEHLVRASQGIDFRIAFFLYVARIFLWLTRKMIAGVMYVGHAISFYMLRQMEYDADRYETRMVGSQAFATTCRGIREIGLAFELSRNDLEQSYREGRLPDNVPRFVISNIPNIPPKLMKLIDKAEQERRTSWFDSHPTDRDRIASAWLEKSSGVFHLPAELELEPASIVFHDFDRICRSFTTQYYQSLLGESFDKKVLRPVCKMIERREAERSAGKALDRYFQAHVPVLRPLPVNADSVKRPESPAQTLEDLKLTREKMLKLAPSYRQLSTYFSQAEKSWLLATEALALAECSLPVKPKQFRLKEVSKSAIREKVKRGQTAMENLGARMLEFETVAEDRLSMALRLLQMKRVWQRIDRGEDLHLEMLRSIPDARAVSRLMSDITPLRSLYRKLSTLCPFLGNKKHLQKAYGSIESQLNEIHSILESLHEKMEGELYPFDHTDAETTLAKFALPHVPDAMDLFGTVNACQELFERLIGLQMRLFARLADAAEKVELAIGLPALPDLIDEDEPASSAN